MDRGSKILIIITCVLVVVSIFFAYNRFFIAKNFTIIDNQDSGF